MAELEVFGSGYDPVNLSPACFMCIHNPFLDFSKEMQN